MSVTAGASGPPQFRARISRLSKTYEVGRERVAALENVTKDVLAGSFTVIAGPSGSGKSSLLRILACVDRPTSGYLEIGGIPTADASRRTRQKLRRRTVGYMFQDPIDNLIEYLSVDEQLRLAAHLRGYHLDDAEADRLLATLGLSDRRDHRPQQLSGGEQQRVAVASSIVGAPALVVADEPTAELDSVSAEAMLDAMARLCVDGASFVVASHDARVIERADHLLRLEYGRVVESW